MDCCLTAERTDAQADTQAADRPTVLLAQPFLGFGPSVGVGEDGGKISVCHPRDKCVDGIGRERGK